MIDHASRTPQQDVVLPEDLTVVSRSLSPKETTTLERRHATNILMRFVSNVYRFF